MKRILTITLLSLFFLAQFGKVISFCYCSIENYRLTGTTDCDCEKNLAGTIKHETNKEHSSTGFQNLHYDELFHFRSINICVLYPSIISSISFNNSDEALYNAYLSSMLRPPSAWFPYHLFFSIHIWMHYLLFPSFIKSLIWNYFA